MRNVSKFLKKIIEFEKFATKRAIQLWYATGGEELDNRPSRIDYRNQEEMITFYFRYAHKDDIDLIDITSYCLELNEEDWGVFLDKKIKDLSNQNEH